MTTDRERLREQWRLAAAAHALAEDQFLRAKEGRQIFLDEIVGELMAGQPGMSASAAERLARTSDAYKAYLNEMHDLRRKRADLALQMADADRRYWECVGNDANRRAEMKMTGFAR